MSCSQRKVASIQSDWSSIKSVIVTMRACEGDKDSATDEFWHQVHVMSDVHTV